MPASRTAFRLFSSTLLLAGILLGSAHPAGADERPRYSQLAGGDNHTLALDTNGVAYGWGGNEFGQVGDGSTTARSRPVQLSSLGSGIKQLAAGDVHSLALRSNGTVAAWGFNGFG